MVDIDIQLHCVAAQEHVSVVERSIRVIKERFCSVYHRLPFHSMPKVMIRLGVMESARVEVQWGEKTKTTKAMQILPESQQQVWFELMEDPRFVGPPSALDHPGSADQTLILMGSCRP